LRVAAEGSIFGVFCRRFGVPLIDLGTVRLPRLIGASRAMDLILTGRPVGAQEAYDIGLANRLVPEGGALAAALELAAQLSAFPQLCMRNDRLSALEQWSLAWDQATANEIRYGMETLRSGSSREGAARFAAGAGRGGKF
jgi:enoyl-CoA hydratase